VCFLTIFIILNIFSKPELFILKEFQKPKSHLHSKFNWSTSSGNKAFRNSSVLYSSLPRTRLGLTQNLLGRRRPCCWLPTISMIIAAAVTAISSESFVSKLNYIKTRYLNWLFTGVCRPTSPHTLMLWTGWKSTASIDIVKTGRQTRHVVTGPTAAYWMCHLWRLYATYTVNNFGISKIFRGRRYEIKRRCAVGMRVGIIVSRRGKNGRIVNTYVQRWRGVWKRWVCTSLGPSYGYHCLLIFFNNYLVYFLILSDAVLLRAKTVLGRSFPNVYSVPYSEGFSDFPQNRSKQKQNQNRKIFCKIYAQTSNPCRYDRLYIVQIT